MAISRGFPPGDFDRFRYAIYYSLAVTLFTENNMFSAPRIIAFALLATLLAAPIRAADKPNILVIWGDDIGQSNISAYTMGLMGYRTPNIDRVAHEGMIFTDYYGEQSCTAGR